MRPAALCVGAPVGAGGPNADSSATATAAMSKQPNTTPHVFFIVRETPDRIDGYCNRPRRGRCYEFVSSSAAVARTGGAIHRYGPPFRKPAERKSRRYHAAGRRI